MGNIDFACLCNNINSLNCFTLVDLNRQNNSTTLNLSLLTHCVILLIVMYG